MYALILGVVLIIYEISVRKLPTERNLSIVDMLKKFTDRIQPNYHKDDFPFKKH